MENQNHTKILIPVTKWGDKHQWPPIGGLRNLIFHSKTNGFDSCIVRAGKRILIDEEKFFEWIDTQNAEINKSA